MSDNDSDIIEENDDIIEESEEVIEESEEGNKEEAKEEIKYVESINYRDYKVPKRNDYIDRHMANKYDQFIKKNKVVFIHPNHIVEYDEKLYKRKDTNSKFRVYLYSVMLDGRKVLVTIQDIPV